MNRANTEPQASLPVRRRPRVRRRGRWVPGLLLGAALGTVAAPGHATIVWEGQEVSAWPDQVLPSSAPSSPNRILALMAPATHLFPHPSGVVHGLTIVVDFSDQASAYGQDEINAWLNQPGYDKFGLKGSVRDYYLRESNGSVDYQNEVHGFYRAKMPKSYYQGGTAYERAAELWAEVTAALDSEIDFSLFDNDHDGKTEAISLLYAGNEGTFGKGLWPHASSSNDLRDGVRLNRYMMAALNDQPTNYTVAHESGHMLFGWPDLYGVGDYCIMGNRDSNANPVGINDAFRGDQGWIEVKDVDRTSNARLTAAPNGAAYRFINPARPTEYFLWSNLQNQDEWQSLKGSGLLVWHFDQAIGKNNPPAVLELAVVQAAAGSRLLGATTWPSPGSATTDLFAAGRAAELSASSQPSSAWNDGSASALRIYDISSASVSMQFSLGTGPLTNEAGGAGGSAGTGARANGEGGVSVSSAGGRPSSTAGAPGIGGASETSGGNSGAEGGDPSVDGGSRNAGSSSGAASLPSTSEPSLVGSASGAASSNPSVRSAAAGNQAGCACQSAALARSPSHHLLSAGLLFGWLFWARRRSEQRTARAGAKRGS